MIAAVPFLSRQQSFGRSAVRLQHCRAPRLLHPCNSRAWVNPRDLQQITRYGVYL